MKIRDIMTSQVEILSPDTTFKDCAKKMKELDVGAMPIGENDRLQGMITDRDLVIRGMAEGRAPDQAQVREAMTSPIIYCFDDDDVESAARIMEVEQVRRMVVLNRNKRLVGIISLGDIAAKLQSEELSGEVLEKVSQPTHQKAA